MSGKDFDGFVVVVTGGSTGLGRAIAVETASRGAAVVVINYASSQAEAEETGRLCEAQGAKAVLVQGDVGEDADCRRIAAAAEPFGRIDALFNNAGVTKFAPNHGDLDAVDADDFLRLYRVNVVGAFQMVRAARTLLTDRAFAAAHRRTACAAFGAAEPRRSGCSARHALRTSRRRALRSRSARRAMEGLSALLDGLGGAQPPQRYVKSP